MARPVWVQVNIASAINASGTAVVDMLGSSLDSLQQSERTVVAIKGDLGIFASTTTSPTPDSFQVDVGMITGVSTLTAADFPNLSADEVVNPGWMYRKQFVGVVTGDGTRGIQTYNDNDKVDVKSKRSLAGIGIQTLWIVFRTTVAVQAGTVRFSGQILLAQKG